MGEQNGGGGEWNRTHPNNFERDKGLDLKVVPQQQQQQQQQQQLSPFYDLSASPQEKMEGGGGDPTQQVLFAK